MVWEGARGSPASEGEVDGGAGREVAWAVQGAAPGCGEKGRKVTPIPAPARCPGCRRLLLQGKEGVNRFPSYSLLEKAPVARSQPAAANKVLQKPKGPPPPLQNTQVILGDAQPVSLGHPLPVGTESGERGRERVGEGVPTTKLFLLLLRQLGKKKKELIWGSKGRAGLDRLGHVRVRLYVMPCARGHGCRHPIDYGTPAAGKIRPQFNAAGDGPTGLFLMTNPLVKVPLLVLARWGGQRQAAPWATGRGQE